MIGDIQGSRETQPLLKICGIRDLAAARLLGELPVDYAGFIFARSRRQIAAAEAQNYIAAMREAAAISGVSAPLAVGVFVNASVEELERIAAEAGLDVLQLHGAESPQACAEAAVRTGLPIWKALHAGAVETEGMPPGEQVRIYAEAGVQALLLDTAGGGTGQTFDWELIPAYLQAARTAGLPLFAAGGLHPGNVSELIEGYRPDGIDVSSGVEQDGHKSPELIRAFTERVKQL
ncbi:phosphoribosylanthranilate isomerase [Paenibacillus pasadenensis]|uniref:phosphoribosylanthranilate isomerase n=1 Tax=Paenibacillus pasadenensis TaxID=217090 RepID=UPI00203F3925|nr:phosphoribosylanthranilate isomerase [Paenibacillus pasadenensis]MCM3747415.1 phosphoribosylanthranilate isomerase [Paenibacillus pasadenensis]